MRRLVGSTTAGLAVVEAVAVVVPVATTNSHSERLSASYSRHSLESVLCCATAIGCLALVLASLQEPAKIAYAASRQSGAKDAGSVGPSVSLPDSGPRESVRTGRAPLSRFQAELKKLNYHQATTPLRVLWIGDSHTAGISWPASVEAYLLRSVASGGPGYIPLGLNYGRYHGARITSDESFDIAPHPPAKRASEDDGVFGLGGTRATPRNKATGISIKLDPTLTSDHATGLLVYRYRNLTDRVVIDAGGQTIDAKGEGTLSFSGGVLAQSFPVNFQAPIEIRVKSGNPELFGIVVENERPGLVIDVLGINGARFATPLAWDEAAWTAQVRWRQPALAVIAYGTNEVFDLVSPKHYESEIRALVGRIRAASPYSECILAGPTDVGRGGKTAEDRVREIDRMQSTVAASLGCAYFSPYDVMGGAEGFDNWLHMNPPLAVSDRIHLTSAGYRKLGQSMAESLFEPSPQSPAF